VAAVAGAPALTAEQLAAEEAALSQRFHDMVASAPEEPLVATTTLALEESVGGLTAGDLDGLLAMLRAGAVLDLDRTRCASGTAMWCHHAGRMPPLQCAGLLCAAAVAGAC
jgi:hypothetical protein